jgi:hypothetical protein
MMFNELAEWLLAPHNEPYSMEMVNYSKQHEHDLLNGKWNIAY